MWKKTIRKSWTYNQFCYWIDTSARSNIKFVPSHKEAGRLSFYFNLILYLRNKLPQMRKGGRVTVLKTTDLPTEITYLIYCTVNRNQFICSCVHYVSSDYPNQYPILCKWSDCLYVKYFWCPSIPHICEGAHGVEVLTI